MTTRNMTPERANTHGSLSLMVTHLRAIKSNGGKVLAEAMLPGGEGLEVASVVLVDLGHEYVVWTCCKPTTDGEYFINGFYTNTLADAKMDFVRRFEVGR